MKITKKLSIVSDSIKSIAAMSWMIGVITGIILEETIRLEVVLIRYLIMFIFIIGMSFYIITKLINTCLNEMVKE